MRLLLQPRRLRRRTFERDLIRHRLVGLHRQIAREALGPHALILRILPELMQLLLRLLELTPQHFDLMLAMEHPRLGIASAPL